MKNLAFFITFLACLIVLSQCFKINDDKFFNSKKITKNLDEPCSITNFEYFSFRYWRSHNLFNVTFSKVNQKMNILPNVTWTTNQSVTYTLYQALPTFSFYSSYWTQDAEMVTKNSFQINGNSVNISVEFKWKIEKNGWSKNGTGLCNGSSQKIAAYIQIDPNDGLPKLKLLDFLPFRQNILILNDTDGTLSDDEMTDLVQFVNWNPSGSSLRQEMIKSVNSIYEISLNEAIAADNKRTSAKFSYTWTNSLGDITINFTRKPLLYFSDLEGTSFGYQTQIDNYQGKCGISPPTDHSFSEGQSSTSFFFYENLLNYAMEKGALDVRLDSSWKTSSFAYKALNLYSLINNTYQYSPDTPVEGYCHGQPNVSKIESSHWTGGYILATYKYNCQMFMNNKVFLNFYVDLAAMVQIAKNFTLTIKQIQCKSTLNEVKGFQIFNKDAIAKIISEAADLTIGAKVFGSGFPQYLFISYPRVNIYDYYLKVYG